MTLCTHGVQTGEGYECSSCVTTGQSIPQDMSSEGVPEVEQEPVRSGYHCGRCKGASGMQGHYYRLCRVINRIEGRKGIETMLNHPFHMCCPGDCDLYQQDGTPKEVGSRWMDFEYDRSEVDETELDAAPDFEQEIARHGARLDAERPAPVTPAEERTGVSDVQAAIADDVAALRVLLQRSMSRLTSREMSDGATTRLDRIEQWVRGEQR